MARSCLAVAALAASLLVAPTSTRAEAPAPIEVPWVGGAALGEEIVVTGTRLPRKDLSTPAPVTIITHDQIVASGRVSLGDFLQTLPEQGNAFNAAVNNGGDGATRISLRSLGPQRTLVLVNGRRYVASGLGADASVDLDSIPVALIERIEVLKDGASSVYGSDAIAGVINVITRNRVTGTEVSASAGSTTRGGGSRFQVSAVTGFGDDRGGMVFGAELVSQRPVWVSDRDWASLPVAYDATGQNNPLRNGPGQYVVGNGTVPAGSFGIPASAVGQPVDNPTGDPRIALYNQLVQTYPSTDKFIHDPSAPLGWRPFVPYSLPPQGDAYNYWPQNYLVTPQQRLSLFASGDRKLADWARASFEASFVNKQTEQLLDPEPLVIGPGGAGVTFSKDSIYNPFGVDLTSLDRRLVELGHRKFTQDTDTWRFVAALDGKLPDAAGPLRGWAWDVSLNWGRSTTSQLITGSLRVPALQNALGPSFVDPALGPQCGTPAAPIAGCVPLDPFGGPGSITPAMLSGVAFTGVTRGTNELFSVSANARGDLFRLRGARPVALAVGYEFRRVMGSFTPDPVSAAGESTGNQLSPVAGAYGVHEGYGEVSIPILSGAPLAEALEADVSARVFQYTTFGTDWTYKLGARWSPVRDFTVRGTWSTAFRAPSIAELYLGQQDNYASVADPCADAATAPASCGAAAGNGDQRTQLRSKVGGNPRLQAETARTFTVGLVVQPRWIRRLTVTLDYYNITVDHTITSIGEATILASCYPADPSVPSRYCDLVRRDPATQQIDTITNLTQNAGKEEVAGVDLALRYVAPTERVGVFSFLVDATWLQHHDLTLPDGTVVTGRGNYDLSLQGLGGVSGVNPAWKFNAATGWTLRGLGAGVSMRLVGSFKECGTPTGDFSGAGLCFVDNTYQRQIDAWMSWDAFIAYTASWSAGRTTVAVGVQNAFDAVPPRIYNAYYATSDPTAYDYLGRFVYVRLNHAL